MEWQEIAWADHQGRSIAYQTFGQLSPDVLAVDIWLTNLDRDWEDPGIAATLRRIGASARLIRFDKSGMGLSDRRPPSPGEALEVWAREAIAVLDAAGSSTASLYSSGWSAPLALTIAARHPDRIDRVAIHGGTAKTTAAVDYPWGVDPEFIAAARDMVREGWGTGVLLDILGIPHDPRMRQRQARYERAAAARCDLPSLVDAYTEADVRHVLSQISMPTLVTYRDGPLQDWGGQAAYIASHIAGSELRALESNEWVFPGANEDPPSHVLIALEFLTGQATERPLREQLLTVVFIDVVGSTGIATRIGDREWNDLLADFRSRLAEAGSETGGQPRGSAGDGFLHTFESPSMALEFCRRMMAEATDLRMELRAGVHVGECQVMGSEIGGIAVHAAARIVSLAMPGQILTSSVYRDLLGFRAAHAKPRGTSELRGLPGAWELFDLTHGPGLSGS